MARRSMTADHGRLNGDKAVVAFAERVREVRQAVERLWHAPTLEDVYDGAPREACVACRADRAASLLHRQRPAGVPAGARIARAATGLAAALNGRARLVGTALAFIGRAGTNRPAP